MTEYIEGTTSKTKAEGGREDWEGEKKGRRGEDRKE